ncbi:hypothetical protein H6F98_16650 [Microcoleus sp. FACHB-SPT15]|nr:hypothetical protein [Microcoleus sp. FACHB-SPT15]MBD1807069.1 hypothetical protein [Microcoleus sp. FACHB-SPT15]
MKITPVPTILVHCYGLSVTDGIETRSQSGMPQLSLTTPLLITMSDQY